MRGTCSLLTGHEHTLLYFPSFSANLGRDIHMNVVNSTTRTKKELKYIFLLSYTYCETSQRGVGIAEF